MLGTGTPNPGPERAGPATASVVDSSAYLVDAGAGRGIRRQRVRHPRPDWARYHEQVRRGIGGRVQLANNLDVF